MKRRAYIGLSSPISYIYDHDCQYFKEQWQWNPIIESPLGLIGLFDELWFLSRALCPVNLRAQEYVKFIDEDSDFIGVLKKINSIFSNYRVDGIISTLPHISQYINFDNNFSQEQFLRYSETIQRVYGSKPGNGNAIDNHSHSFDLCGLNINGNSMRLDYLIYDMAFIEMSEIANIELITNRFNNGVFNTNRKSLQDIQVTQGIIINRIPCIQMPIGPVIDKIECIRENKYLVDFRQKILSTNETESFSELVNSIEGEFTSYRNNILLQHQQNSRLLSSIANNALSLTLGTIVPGVGEIKSLISDTQTRKFNWTGFIAELEQAK